jgi:guanine deaminase
MRCRKLPPQRTDVAEGAAKTVIHRAAVLHTPASPFTNPDALSAHADGAVAVRQGRILDSGEFHQVREKHPAAEISDRRGSWLLPGFVDTHVHYPQLGIIGSMGLPLLQWLEDYTLPEEARFADNAYASAAAGRFLTQLLRSGTTSALVFGAHFAGAMQEFFTAAEASGLRITSGLVLADRNLRPELHVTPARAIADSSRLIEQWHGRGRLRYAVTPRFSLSASSGLLAACSELLQQADGLFFTTHLNENAAEIDAVASLFPETRDYLDTYEQHGLLGRRSLFAHNVHPSDSELQRLALSDSSICHCPTSNMFLGSGLFPLRRHLEAGVRVALGTDVGAGTGFGILKEGLAAYQMQMLRPDPLALTPAQLLYLATAAGAEALELEQCGSFLPGKSFDAVLLTPPQQGALALRLQHAEKAEEALGALLTLAGTDTISEVYVEGARLYSCYST